MMEKKHGSFVVKTNDGLEIHADAVVLATGFDLFKSSSEKKSMVMVFMIMSSPLPTLKKCSEKAELQDMMERYQRK